MRDPIGVRRFICAVIAALIPVAWAGFKLGSGFLRQFFISPFQFFILVPWGFALYALKTGAMPQKSGPALRRDRDPGGFWMNLRFCVVMGFIMFAFNFFISWTVVTQNQLRAARLEKAVDQRARAP